MTSPIQSKTPIGLRRASASSAAGSSGARHHIIADTTIANGESSVIVGPLLVADGISLLIENNGRLGIL